jgi:hypothetical protein
LYLLPVYEGIRGGTRGAGSVTFLMTNLGDVIRQVETALCDPCEPPTSHEQEVYAAILREVCTGTVDAKGSR